MDIELHLLLDHAVTQFEQNWFSTTPVSIEEVLSSFASVDRRILLSMLLQSDIELRLENLQEIPAESYFNRFPGDRDIVTESLNKFNLHESSGTWRELGERFSPHGENGTTANLANFRTIGPYLPTRIIARGGMGVVMEGVHQTLRRRVAIKVIRLDRIDACAIDRFQQEARAAAAVKHPNVISIFDQNRDGDCWYFAMELIEGKALSEIVAKENRDVNELLSMVASAADGLQAAHELGVVHRDIKPQNILVRTDGSPVIIDFGLARSLETEHLTKTGEFIGTPAYAAPEQMIPDGQIGPPTDIHALGTILYEIATGGLPFKGQNSHQIMRRIIDEVPVQPSSIEPLVPKDLNTIILKCLEKVPSNRYASAKDLARDLRSFIDGNEIVARPIPVSTRVWRLAKRRPQVALAAGFTVLTLVVVSIAALGFMKSAKAEAELARIAIARRDEANRNSEQSLLLLDQANSARLESEELARFSECQQLQATIYSVDLSIRTGRYDQANLLLGTLRTNQPQSFSFDTRWYEHVSDVSVDPISHFCTSNWGLYDYSFSPDKSKLATVDKTGRVDLWQLKTGKRIIQLEKGTFDRNLGTCRPRWQFKCGRATDNPGVRFYSSIAWESDGQSLLLADLDGQVERWSTDGASRSRLVESEHQLHWLRTSSNGQFIVCDERGELTQFTSQGNPLGRFHAGATVSCVKFEPQSKKWIIGDRQGNVRVLNENLVLLAEYAIAGKVHDCSLVEWNDERFRILVSAESQPVFELRGVSQKDGWKVERGSQWQIPDREANAELLQAQYTPGASRLLALDNRGNMHLWMNDPNYVSLPIGQPTEIRFPTENEAERLDFVENRIGIGLVNLDGILCQISRLGTVKLFDADGIVDKSPWIPLSTKIGPKPQIVNATQNHFWVLDHNGRLSYLDCAKDREIAFVERAHSGDRASIVVLSDAQIATIGGDRFIKFWKLGNGDIQEVRRIDAGTELTSLAVHEAQDLLAVVCENGDTLAFRLASGQLLHRLINHASTENTDSQAQLLSKVLTGKVGFSCSGKFLAAYGIDQTFRVVETDSWKSLATESYGIAGNGGTVVHFSPLVDHRVVLGSTIDTHSNSIRLGGKLGLRVPKTELTSVCLDSKSTFDRKRIALLQNSREIVFVTGEHLQKVCSIPVPLQNPRSFAFGEFDASIVVASDSGELIWAPLQSAGQGVPNKVIGGKVIQPQVDFSAGSISPGSPNVPFLAPTDDGGFKATFNCGNTSSLTDPSTRSYLLEKSEGRWVLKKIDFDGVEDGPAQSSQVFISSTGATYVVIRQGNIDDYDGRTILLHPDGLGRWQKEVVAEKGNMGFSPLLRFDKDGTPFELIHFDCDMQRLLQTRKHENGDWLTEHGITRAGYRSSFVHSPANELQLLLTPSHGNGSDAPSLFARTGPNKNQRITSEEHWNAPSGTLLSTSSGRVFCVQQKNGDILERIGDGEWSVVTAVGKGGFPLSIPFIDSFDRLWFCAINGGRLECHCYDFTSWQHLAVELSESVDGRCHCHCFLSPQLKLTVLAKPLDIAKFPFIIEVQIPSISIAELNYE